MSPLLTKKFLSASEKLIAIGLIPSAVDALSRQGPDALYTELSRRGYVWSVDLSKWRRSLKVRRAIAQRVHGTALETARFRIIVEAAVSEAAISEMKVALGAMGYTVVNLNVHAANEPGKYLVYFTVHGGENGNG